MSRSIKLYKSEHQLTKLIGIFSVVCIFIACLGLFGLASFTTEQRTREIGTRKVLGATAWQIIALLSRRILVLVLIASVLAAVIAYFAIDEWLRGFAYRAGINPMIFVLSAAAARLWRSSRLPCSRSRQPVPIRWKRCGTSNSAQRPTK